MFTLPKNIVKTNANNPHKSYLLNLTQNRKKPNINQIKQEIEHILKRNTSPFTLNPQKQTLKSHRHLHTHLLQRKRSQILQRANQQNLQNAKNNRKIYQEYLMGELAPKTYSKTIEPKPNSHQFTSKQNAFSKQLQPDLPSSKANLNSSRALQLLARQKKSQSMFTDKEIKHLGLGKLLFYKDSNIKLKRSSLLDGRTSTDRSNLFKDTAMQSFYQEHSLDITRYLSHFDKPTVQEDEVKDRKVQNLIPKERSLEIFRKDLIPKEPFSQQMTASVNPQELGVKGTQKNYALPSQRQSKRTLKHDLSPHLKESSEQMRQTLNVMDEQLLVYYGKMKSRKPSKGYLPSATHRAASLRRSGSREKELNGSGFFQLGVKTSIEIKKPLVKQQSWKFQHFDPWEKNKHDEELDHENVFGKMEADMKGITDMKGINVEKQGEVEQKLD